MRGVPADSTDDDEDDFDDVNADQNDAHENYDADQTLMVFIRTMKIRLVIIYSWLAADVNCCLPYADSEAPDQPAHAGSLI